MYTEFYRMIKQWNTATSQRQKLQHAYIVIAIIAVIIAGIVSLLNVTQGRRILYVAGAAVAAFVCNAVIWSIVETMVTSRLDSDDTDDSGTGNGSRKSPSST